MLSRARKITWRIRMKRKTSTDCPGICHKEGLKQQPRGVQDCRVLRLATVGSFVENTNSL